MDAIAIPPKTFGHLSLDAAVTPKLIESFALAKAGHGRRANAKHGSKTIQQLDYESKMTAFAGAYAAECEEPLTLDALPGPRIEYVLARKRSPKTGRPLRPSTRNSYRILIQSFVAWLFTAGIISRPIAPAVSFEPEDDDAEPVVFTADQIRAAFRAIAANATVPNRRLLAMTTLTLDVGLRNFEVCGLSFEDLDRVGQRIHVKGKKHKERWLPVSPQTWRVVDCYLAVRTSNLQHVFVTDDGLRPIMPATLNRQLGRILTSLGLVDHIAKEDPENPSDMADEPRDAAGLCWQALRRTFATFYVASGRTEDELRAMMGWSREYAHAVREHYIARRTVTQLQSVHASSTIVNTLFKSH